MAIDQYGFTYQDQKDFQRERDLAMRIKRRPIMGAVRSSPNDQVDLGPRVGMGDVRSSPNDQVAPTYATPGSYPTSSYTQAPAGAPTPEEMATIKRAALLRNMAARGDQRMARAGAYQMLQNPGASPMDRAAAFNARDLAESNANYQQGEYNQAANVGRVYQSPEQVAANRADLQRQFRMNTTGGQSVIPPTPQQEATTFFLGNGADRYPGAGNVYMRGARANFAAGDMNADQNRPRELAFDPYAQPNTPGLGSEGVYGSPAMQVAMLRRQRDLASRMAGNEAETMRNESDLGPVMARTKLALARGGEGNAPLAIGADRAGLEAATAKGGRDVAQYGAERKAYEEGTDTGTLDSKIKQTQLRDTLRRANVGSALSQVGIGDPQNFLNAATQFASSLGGATGYAGAGLSDAEATSKLDSFDTQILATLERLAASGPEGEALARQLASQIHPAIVNEPQTQNVMGDTALGRAGSLIGASNPITAPIVLARSLIRGGRNVVNAMSPERGQKIQSFRDRLAKIAGIAQ